ncbi:MAG: CamS family sex pheromone protein, partial [Bacillus sp. (in: firmicutes)]
MKKLSFIGVGLALLLAGCAPNLDGDETTEKATDESAKAIIPKYQISDSYYRTILPFEPSAARG